MSKLERFDRGKVRSYRNTAGTKVNVRAPAYIEVLREPVDMLVECAIRRGVETPTPPAVEVARIKDSINVALIPQASLTPAFFAVNWGTDTRRATISLYEYFAEKKITVPPNEWWKVPVTFEDGDDEDGPYLILHLDQREVGGVTSRNGATDEVAAAAE